MVNTGFAGRLGDPHALAGLGLSNVLINGLWFTTFNGFSGALQTMVSQASSIKDYKSCNNTLRAALVVLILLYIPLGVILYKIDYIMGKSMLNAEPQSVEYAVTYTRTVMIGFFFEAIYDLEKKYLLQFGDSLFPMFIQLVTLPLHFVINSYLYNWIPRSLFGIALATNVAFFLNFIALHIYITYYTKQPYKFQPWKNLTAKKIKRSVKEYVRLGVPSALMTYFDYWIYTVLLFLSSELGVVANAAQVILFNITSSVYAMGLGFGQATCTLVGNNLSKGKFAKAKSYIGLAMGLM
jgi:Na+-driven multidrug efflux pump